MAALAAMVGNAMPGIELQPAGDTHMRAFVKSAAL
jgi:hypothetical protein